MVTRINTCYIAIASTVSFVTQQALTGIAWYQHEIPVNMVSTCDVRATYIPSFY